MGRLFGTDGARGIANSELTCELAMNIGRAAAYVLTKHSEARPKVLIGKDTRVSSSMLELALASGLCSVGADVVLAGFIPTPAVAYLVANSGADSGVMISASHNPCEYNGIKLFDKDGYKLPDCLEEEIEAIVLDNAVELTMPVGGDVGNVFYRPDYIDKYINHIVSSIDVNLDGLKIAIDCANGCASTTAEKIFSRLGAKCHMIHDNPNGVNINEHCGSTHMEDLIDYVNANGMDLGLAFDGDSDRCLAVDECGKLIDGDKLIAVFAKEFKRSGRLNGDAAVLTVMSNIGFKHFARENGINVIETAVGDRYVLEEMLKNDYSIGGEQSGHIIFKDFATTGDGQLSGVQYAASMIKNKKTASQLASVMESFPQTMINVTADTDGKSKLKTDETIIKSIDNAAKILGEDGRILVRASGTEPLIRVMIEGKDIHLINKLAREVAAVITERASE
ncbi:MAG: phosphoglucosamine mutase [Oscillospiraceae bacterium]|nr:phosphoglucosamine mutase [Oscillospiraceae bacterium]